MYADKVGFCDTIQCTNIDDVEREAKLHLVHSSSQTDDVTVTSPVASDKIYAQNFDAAIAKVDKVFFGMFMLIYSLCIAIVLAVMIV